MILASVENQDGEYVERLFLQNSKDLVRLLVSFNIAQYHPQLHKCLYTQGLLDINESSASVAASQARNKNNTKNSGTKLARKIQQWQE